MHELVLQVPHTQVETLSQALMELESVSVSVEDADAGTSAEHALFGEPGESTSQQAWPRSVLQALFMDEHRATQAATWVVAQAEAQDIQVVALREMADQDWVRLTQSQFEPVAITPQFWVVPSWHDVPAQAQRHIRLDPGLAFGTGTHPTTQMCLRWIAAQAGRSAPPQRVLDYGCGSGILAIGAALHGAVAVDALDIDPDAVRAAAANAQANGVTLRTGLPDRAQGAYDWVLANILAMPLQLLAPLLCHHVSSGGHLVLAGILARQADALKNAYAACGLTLEVVDQQEEWILMWGQGQPPNTQHRDCLA